MHHQIRIQVLIRHVMSKIGQEHFFIVSIPYRVLAKCMMLICSPTPPPTCPCLHHSTLYSLPFLHPITLYPFYHPTHRVRRGPVMTLRLLPTSFYRNKYKLSCFHTQDFKQLDKLGVVLAPLPSACVHFTHLHLPRQCDVACLAPTS